MENYRDAIISRLYGPPETCPLKPDMRYYQYFWKILVKYKWVLLATVGIPVVATALFCVLSTPLYESESEIYPVVLKENVDMMPLNPCYQVKRIVHSSQFRQLLVDSKVCPSLCEENYDRRIDCRETPRHTLKITALAETPGEADALAAQFLHQLDYAATYLTSARMAVSKELYEQVSWDYYHKQVDFTPESPLRDTCDSISTHYLFDVLTPPTCSSTPAYPPNLLKSVVFVLLISAFLSFVGVCLAEEIRNRVLTSRIPHE